MGDLPPIMPRSSSGPLEESDRAINCDVEHSAD
jgi:hypothetical protein